MSLPTEIIYACLSYVLDDIDASGRAAREGCVVDTLKSLSTVCRAWRHTAWPMILDRSTLIVSETFQVTDLLLPCTAGNVKRLAFDDSVFHHSALSFASARSLF